MELLNELIQYLKLTSWGEFVALLTALSTMIGGFSMAIKKILSASTILRADLTHQTTLCVNESNKL